MSMEKTNTINPCATIAYHSRARDGHHDTAAFINKYWYTHINEGPFAQAIEHVDREK
jgi:hypothetical protein